MDQQKLKADLFKFADDRDWHQFHSPKNFAMAVSSEAGELLDHFIWLTQEQSRNIMQNPQKAKEIENEVADVLISLVQLARLLDIDLEQALYNKLEILEQRFPANQVRGTYQKVKE